MRTYKDKEELKNEINKSFEKYISEFDNIPESLKDKRIIEVDRTPAENLAYQVGWTTLVLKWEDDEKQGIEVKTPSDMFKWNQLGEGALAEIQNQGIPIVIIEKLKDSLDCNLYFFGSQVNIGTMYMILGITILVLIGIYILLNKSKKYNR